jgi:hypothetical protein
VTPRSTDSLPEDQLSDELRGFSDAVVDRLSGTAEIDVERWKADGSLIGGAHIVPRAPGAVSVQWEQFADGIVVGVGWCEQWELPRTSAGIATLRSVVDAAATGSIEVGVGRGQTHYRVRLPDGSVLEAVHEGFKAWLLSMPWKPRLVWGTAAPYS